VEVGAADPAASPGAQTLLAVHEHLRQELDQLREVMAQVAAGRTSAAAARSHLHQMTMRQHYWTFGAFCAAVDRLADALLPHLQVEEDHLLAPITNLGIQV